MLLTGSTGNLGAEILSKLLLDNSLEKIYVFNRRGTSGSEDRHHRRFNDKGFDASVLKDTRLIYLEGDASAEKLGLDDVNYQAVSIAPYRRDSGLTLDIASQQRDSHYPQCMDARFQPHSRLL